MLLRWTDAELDAKLAEIKKVDYERIGEREYAEFLFLDYAGNGADAYVALVKKAIRGRPRAGARTARTRKSPRRRWRSARTAKPILNGANKDNLDAMNAVATEAGVVLGVSGENLSEIYDNDQGARGQGQQEAHHRRDRQDREGDLSPTPCWCAART